MILCGRILSTESYTFFSLRCAYCSAVYGQWNSFVKHLVAKHGKESRDPAPAQDEQDHETSHINGCSSPGRSQSMRTAQQPTEVDVLKEMNEIVPKTSDEHNCDDETENGDDDSERDFAYKEELDTNSTGDDSGSDDDVKFGGSTSPMCKYIQDVHYKNQEPYKRIRYDVVPNPIFDDFVALIKENPKLHNSDSYPPIREMKNIMLKWTEHFRNKHKVELSYTDLRRSLRSLRFFYYRQLRIKKPSKNGLRIMELCNFLGKPRALLPPRHRLACTYCHKTYFTSNTLKIHLFQKHEIGEDPLCCVKCGKSFQSHSVLKGHISVVHQEATETHDCPVCQKFFRTEKCLARHSSVHKDEQNFICPQCGQGFRTKYSLQCHENRIHYRARNYACDYCPKAFYTSNLLRDHRNTHLGLCPHKCPFCDKGFHSAHSLMRHKQIHSEVKRYKCKICPAEFHQFVGLNAHMKKRHDVYPSKAPPIPLAPSITESSRKAEFEILLEDGIQDLEVLEEFSAT